jgi:hypothetical protein
MNAHDYEVKKSLYESLTALGFVLLGFGFIFITIQPGIGFLFFIGGGALSAIMASAFKKLSTKFKLEFVKKSIEELYPGSSFHPEQGFSSDEVYGTLVLKKEDRFSSEDMIEGKISNRRFRCADLHLQDVRSNGKSTTVVTVFRGRFYEIEFEKTLATPVYIVANQTIFTRFSGFEKMEMEYVEFNKAFDVFGQDALSTFRLIKPRFMEHIMSLKNRYNGIQFGFIGNKLYVAIKNGIDTFDLKMFRPIDLSYLDEIKKEFEDITIMIETLTSEL